MDLCDSSGATVFIRIVSEYQFNLNSIVHRFKNKLIAFYRDASINRLSHLHLSDGRYKQRSNNVSTILEQFLRGKGAVIGLSLLVESDQWKLNDFSWQCTLIPLSNIIAQLM